MFHKIHERTDLDGDIVHQRATALHINSREVFARAFAHAGLDRSDAEIPHHDYSSKSGTGVIPPVVIEFCELPLPTCANPDCPHPDRVGRFSRTDQGGTTTNYFCSPECLDATKDMVITVANSDVGLAILERVRIALSNSTYIQVNPNLIRPLPGQPRRYFNMGGLLQSLRSVGQAQPGIIRSVPTDSQGHEYELLDGERRWRGVREIGIPHYRAMLVEIDDQAAPFVVSVITNFNHQEHTLLELVDSIVKMHESLKIKINKIADMLGMHPVNVTNLYGLRRLPPEIRDMLDPQITPKDSLLSKTAAIKIAAMTGSPQAKIAMAERIVKDGLTVEGLNRHLQISGGGGHRRVRGPLETRSNIASKATRIASLLGDLKMLLHSEAGGRAFTGEFEASLLEDTRARLDTARVLINDCVGLLPETKTIVIS